MQIIKQKIRKTGVDSNIKIPISLENNELGYQQEIDNLTQFTSDDLVNPAIDGEMRKFKFDPVIGMSIFRFYFYNSSLGYDPDYINVDFTQDEIDNKESNFANSFFILDFYDSYDPNTQTRLFTTYNSKLGADSIFNVNANSPSSELYYWYVPVWYIEQVESTGYVYGKFSFYDAKSGKIILFYNKDNEELTTPEINYFKMSLDYDARTWKFASGSVINAYDLKRVDNTKYFEKIESSITQKENLQQDYPDGVHNYADNKYDVE